ncbi:unnamed protein product [Rhizoctonia solani]|uniref:O-methylsterigmatocystin oxidoreductase n=1 Tax=Rhizoctonia solani TaxID=456999 RepID=A0A8H2WX40_9AGAM|nr:unnamed protein product [Rhizoctonia solani]
MNNWFNTRATTQFRDLQERQAQMLLRRLLNLTDHIRPFEGVKDEFFFATASLMFELAYGYSLQSPQDPFFKEATQAYHNLASASMHTRTGWKRTAREWRIQQERAKNEPYQWVKSEVAAGRHQPSLLSALVQDHSLLSTLSPADRDERAKEIGSILFGGGTDTVGKVLAKDPAMVTNPHVQARAQKELDAVLGQDTLPSISDMNRLPYIKNLIEELWRLYPVFPLGNVWAMSRDPRYYKDPEVFDPDRYQDPSVPRPPVFGWGRRKCPGIHFAEASAFITIASLLTTFTFSKKRNGSGQEVMPEIEAERNSLVLELKPFDFEFKSRSEVHYQLNLKSNVDME